MDLPKVDTFVSLDGISKFLSAAKGSYNSNLYGDLKKSVGKCCHDPWLCHKEYQCPQ